MTYKEFETLKLGDVVSQTKGRNKGQPAEVSFIWDLTDSDGYREIIIFARYKDPSLRNEESDSDFGCNYIALKLEGA